MYILLACRLFFIGIAEHIIQTGLEKRLKKQIKRNARLNIPSICILSKIYDILENSFCRTETAFCIALKNNSQKKEKKT